MARITIMGGDLPRGSEFYNNPGSIGGFAVAAVAQADPESVARLGVAKPFGLAPKVCFLATLADGRRALAATDPRTYARLERDIADGPPDAKAVADRKKENTRTGVLFLAVYFLSLFFFARHLAGYLPFLAAFAVAVAAVLAGNVLFARLSGR